MELVCYLHLVNYRLAFIRIIFSEMEEMIIKCRTPTHPHTHARTRTYVHTHIHNTHIHTTCVPYRARARAHTLIYDLGFMYRVCARASMYVSAFARLCDLAHALRVTSCVRLGLCLCVCVRARLSARVRVCLLACVCLLGWRHAHACTHTHPLVYKPEVKGP